MTFFTLILYPVLNKARLETSKHCQTPDATLFRYTHILDKMLTCKKYTFLSFLAKNYLIQVSETGKLLSIILVKLLAHSLDTKR